MHACTGTACPRHGTQGATAILFFVHLRTSWPKILAEKMPEAELRGKLPEFSTCVGCRNLLELFLRGAATCRLREPTEEELVEVRATEAELGSKDGPQVEYTFVEGVDHAGLVLWAATMPALKLTSVPLYWNGRRYTLERPPTWPDPEPTR